MLSKTKIHLFQERFFNLFIIISYTLTFVAILGLSTYAPELLKNIDYYVRIYICLYLIFRFNPLRKRVEFTDLDRKITFSAGLFIFTTTIMNSILKDYIGQIKNLIAKI